MYERNVVMKNKKGKELKGANMDIDLVSENVDWSQTSCPWNDEENTKEHKCAVKDTSICKYFCGLSIWIVYYVVTHMKIYMC